MALRARLIPTPPAPDQEWRYHEADWKALPAHLLWRGDRRMEGETYLAKGYQVRIGIEERAAGWKRLKQVASISLPNRTKGILVDSEFGVPWYAPTQVFSTRPIPRKWLAEDKISNPQDLRVNAGTILVTRSGSVGKALQAPKSLEGAFISDDLLRVKPNDSSLSGWLYGFLLSSKARLMMTSSHYGQIIKHLEPAHMEALPIPIVSKVVAKRFLRHAKEILVLRNSSHNQTLQSEELFEDAIGPIKAENLGEEGYSIPSSCIFTGRRRLEGGFHNPLASALPGHHRKRAKRIQTISQAGYQAWIPNRFKRTPAIDGAYLLDSSNLFEWNPPLTKRIAECNFGDDENGRVRKGWILLARSGQSYGIIGTSTIATSAVENKVVSDHIMRVRPTRESDLRVGYLHTVLSHPTLGRPMVKALVCGSSIPEIDVGDLLALPIPRLEKSVENQIADLAEAAAEDRAKADEIETLMAAEADELLNRFVSGDVRDFIVTMSGTDTIHPRASRPLGEHECVRLIADRPDAGLVAGTVGAIVYVYPDYKAFEVEFPGAKAGAEVLTLVREDIAPIDE